MKFLTVAQTLLLVIILLVNASIVVGGFRYVTEEPLTYPNQPLAVLTDQIKEGSYLSIEENRCNNTNGALVYYHISSLLNINTNVKYPLGITPIRMDTRGCETFTAVINLPDRLPIGTYYYFGTSTITDGFITRNVYWRTETFEVVP